MMARWQAEVLFALLLAAAGAVTVFGAREYGVGWSNSGPEPGTFPFYTGVIVLTASLVNAMRAAIPALRSPEWSHKPFMTKEQASLVFGFVAPIIALVAISLVLGLYMGMALYLFGTLVFQNAYPVRRALPIALGVPVFCYLLIERVFKVAMLKGPLEAALGL